MLDMVSLDNRIHHFPFVLTSTPRSFIQQTFPGSLYPAPGTVLHRGGVGGPLMTDRNPAPHGTYIFEEG